ncbi:MAG: Smr/MutS family protein, partial [Gemmatimonadota bacterium]
KRVEEALSLARGAADEAAAKEARRLVEEGIRTETGRLDEEDVLPAGDPAALRAGSRVRLGTGATGDVVEIRSDGKAVVLVGTMRLVVVARTLTLLPPEAPARRGKTVVPRGDAPTREAAYELDLRGMRADEAESLVQAAIDNAVIAEQPHLAIIHGMGTGVLRDTVRSMLAADKRVASFDFAPRQQGGVGVTVAVFR